MEYWERWTNETDKWPQPSQRITLCSSTQSTCSVPNGEHLHSYCVKDTLHFLYLPSPYHLNMSFSCQWVTPTIPKVKEREQPAAHDVNQLRGDFSDGDLTKVELSSSLLEPVGFIFSYISNSISYLRHQRKQLFFSHYPNPYHFSN